MRSALVLALFPVTPFAAAAIGWVLARWAGRPAEFWRISLPVFVALVSALGIYSGWPPRLGVDLAGGIRIVYEIQPPDDGQQAEVPLIHLAETLRHRIDPYGTEAMIVRPYGPAQVEILTPTLSASEMDEIKKLVTTAGHLQFRILADLQRDKITCQRADYRGQAESRIVTDGEGEPIAEWVKTSKDELGRERLQPDELLGHKTRTDEVTGETEILMLIDPFNVEGKHLARAWAGYDYQMQPCLHFALNSRGSVRFGALTGANLPQRDIDFYRKLGIIMDQELVSAPRIMSRISDRGQVTGKFTISEVELLADVLKAGRLPVRLKPMSISEERIGGSERTQWVHWCLTATFAALLLISAFAVFRFGRQGFAAAVSIWLGTAVLAAGLLAAGVTFIFPTVVAMCAVALALAISLAVLCGVTRTCQPSGGDAVLPASPARSWPFWAVVAFAPLFAVAAVIYVLGLGEVRQTGQPLVIGAVSGVASVVLCFWPLKGLFATTSDSEDTEPGVVMAEMSDDDTG